MCSHLSSWIKGHPSANLTTTPSLYSHACYLNVGPPLMFLLLYFSHLWRKSYFVALGAFWDSFTTQRKVSSNCETVSLPAIIVFCSERNRLLLFPAECFLIALQWDIPTLFSCDGLIFTQTDSNMKKGWRFLWLYFTTGLFLHSQHGPLTCQLQSFALFRVPYFLILGWTRTASSLVPLVAVVGQYLSLSSEANSVWPLFFLAHPKAFIWFLQGLIRPSASDP